MNSRISLFLSLVIILAFGCKKDDPSPVNPNITNASASVQECDSTSAYYSIVVNFDYEGAEDSEEFSIGVSDEKEKYGTFAFSELPVMITGLLGDNWNELEINLYVPKEDSVNKQVFPLEIPALKDCIDIVTHDRWTSLLAGNVSQAGNVNYPGIIARFDELREYLDILRGNAPDSNWTEDETMCYWINAYNAFTVNLILENYPLQSIMDLNDPWGRRSIIIGEDSLSLDMIEHEILRPDFDYDPRIHFAVNCASTSCPPLLGRAFVPETLQADLDNQAFRFVNTETYNTLSFESIEVSQIFHWFVSDFSAIDTTGLNQIQRDAQIVQYIDGYTNQSIDPNATVSYREYDWSLND